MQRQVFNRLIKPSTNNRGRYMGLLYKIALCLFLVCSQTRCFFMEAPSNNSNTSSDSAPSAINVQNTQKSGNTCDLTVQVNALLNYCYTIVISNTSSNEKNKLSGWNVQFDIPQGSFLSNTYGAVFTVVQDHVTVTPSDPNSALFFQNEVTAGFCTQSNYSGINADPGTCS